MASRFRAVVSRLAKLLHLLKSQGVKPRVEPATTDEDEPVAIVTAEVSYALSPLRQR